MGIRKDMFGREPLIGDTIVYNPPGYKGLEQGIVIGYSTIGLPKVSKTGNPDIWYTPKTGFVVVDLK